MADTPKFSEGTLAELLAGYQKPEDLLGKGGILKQLTKALVKRTTGAQNQPPFDPPNHGSVQVTHKNPDTSGHPHPTPTHPTNNPDTSKVLW